MKCVPINEEEVYSSWFRHEQKTRNNVPDAIRWELPRRAGNPSRWCCCLCAPTDAQEFIVGENWKDWTEWSKPEGSYACVALNIKKKTQGDPDRLKIEQLSRNLLSELVKQLFIGDPVILKKLPSSKATVIEGHHRITAICLLLLCNKVPRPFLAYMADC